MMPQAKEPIYNDQQWRSLNLPHDWSIEGAFNEKTPPHKPRLVCLRV
jgi:beta-galactosidase